MHLDAANRFVRAAVEKSRIAVQRPGGRIRNRRVLRVRGIRHDIDVSDGTRFIQGFLGPASGDQLIDLGLSNGTIDGLEAGGVLVFADVAEDRSLSVGDVIAVEFPDLQTEQLVVAGIFEDNALDSPWVIDLGTYKRHVTGDHDDIVAVSFADGVDGDVVTNQVLAITDEYRSVSTETTAEITESFAEELDLVLIVINSLLALALFIAFLGVINTIVLSVVERTREVGLLRAVGMTQRQVKGAIRWESVMVCLFGAGLGIALGVVFAWAAVSAVPDNVVARVAIPYESVLFIVLVAVLAGIVAALIPARRAAKLDVLEAIATGGG